MNDRTLTAVYETKATAEDAKQRLTAAGVASGAIDIHEEKSFGASTPSPKEGGVLAGLRGIFGSHDDTHAYAEGMSRGHVLLTARVDETRADEAVRVLEGTPAIDFDKAQSDWRGSGWKAPAAAATSGDEAIPIVQERLVVGKREVDRGGVRVRSYVVETPVSEQVSLREENVSVERRPVDRALTGTEDAFRDRTIAMTETGEEAVVGKQAFVKEELTIKKDVSQRTEEVNDTVRHTEVEVERLAGSDKPDPAKRV